MIRWVGALLVVSLLPGAACANPPVASYVFPAGGRAGDTVNVRVGGLFLHRECRWEVLGPGVTALAPTLKRIPTRWFEGPVLPLPDSQQAEDYPKDLAGQVRLDADAAPGIRYLQLWTSEGVTGLLRFQVGDLPEVVEEELAGDPVAVPVTLPVTINGRIFPREDVDAWGFQGKQGRPVTCAVAAAQLGSPLDARLEVRDAAGRVLAEATAATGADPVLRFTPPADGTYEVRIHDVRFQGGQAFVYRLTVTDGPFVDRVYPLGGRRGQATAFTLTGQGVPETPVTVHLPADTPAEYRPRFAIPGGRTNPILVDVDDLPEYRSDSRPTEVTAPAMLNGCISRPGAADDWLVRLAKGVTQVLAVRAVQLGSPLFAVVTVSDPKTGKELARAESDGTDPVLRFTPPADGVYTVRVAERFRHRGGPAYAYRLRLAPEAGAPDFRLHLPPVEGLTLPRGPGKTQIKVTAERLGGFKDAIPLAVEGLPPGVKVAGAVIPANAQEVTLTFTADDRTPIQSSRISVRGTVTLAGQAATRIATLPVPHGQPPLETVRLAVALPAPFKVIGEYDMRWAHRGGTFQRRYKVERTGFDGPLEVSLADRQMRHLQGVTGPIITVPAGATEFTYAIQLPPWMETGRTCRACVMAEGVVKDFDGTEHVVSYSSVHQNEQMVAVVEPGRLGLSADVTSVRVVPGGAAAVTVQVQRGRGLTGPIRLSLVLPDHVRGITMAEAEVPERQETVTITLRFAADARGPFTAPAVLRAVAAEGGAPMTAEVPLALVAVEPR